MIPGFIRRLIGATLVVAMVVLIFLVARDWRIGIYFAVSTLWMLGNLLIWTAISHMIVHPVLARRLWLLGLVGVKLLFLLLGVVALNLAPPVGRGQVLAVVAGITLVFFVAVLKAVGALLTGRDVLKGTPKVAKPSGERGVEG